MANMHINWTAVALTALFVSFACSSSRPEETLSLSELTKCQSLLDDIDWNKQIEALNRLSFLYDNACYEDVISYGTDLRERMRHKTFSLINETAEFFTAEGAVTEYVLESYERGYLSFLIAASYLRTKQTSEVAVELNRFYNEEVAILYNYGQDPVNALLQAVMWENFPREGFSARPFWLWLTKQASTTSELKKFAKSRIKALDTKLTHQPWQIVAVGKFPELDWSMEFLNSKHGYFKIKPQKDFAKACASESEFFVSTSSWFEKIAVRHSHSYHPLVNAKSWIRLPFGMFYAVTTATAGAGIAVAGCMVGGGLHDYGGICRVSVESGTAVAHKSKDVVDYVLSPDLRHWQEVPEAIYINMGPLKDNGRCFKEVKKLGYKTIL